VVCRGLGYNPADYLQSGVDSANLVPEAINRTLVIAPHLLTRDTIPADISEYFLYWNLFPFWGTQRAFRGPRQEQVSISAYTVLDKLLAHIVDSRNFPNLERIVIAGHSAGGQMVNRYAASNRYDVKGVIPPHIETRYVVMAPASYLYLDENRAVPGTVDRFAIPASPPADYNDYGLGLNNLWAYMAATGAEAMRRQYRVRNVYYLVGSEDTTIDSDDSQAVRLQGPERLTRSEIFYNYLGFYYGQAVYNNHKRAVVSGVGHWGRGLMLSSEGLYFLHCRHIQHQLSLHAGNGGTTDPAPGKYFYPWGTQVHVAAVPDNHHIFTAWTGDVSSTANPIEIMMTADKTVTANFRSVLPPSNARGQKVLNRSLLQSETIHILQWETNPNNAGIEILKHRIYRNEGYNWTLLAELDSGVLEYWRRKVDPATAAVYTVVVVTQGGHEGLPAYIRIQ